MGSPGLWGDQQVPSHGVCTQGQPQGFKGLPTPVCRGCKGGKRGGLGQSSSQVILPSVIEEGAVSLLSSKSLGLLGEPSVWHLRVPILYNDMETHLSFL